MYRESSDVHYVLEFLAKNTTAEWQSKVTEIIKYSESESIFHVNIVNEVVCALILLYATFAN